LPSFAAGGDRWTRNASAIQQSFPDDEADALSSGIKEMS
jgi:hypothetical protein